MHLPAHPSDLTADWLTDVWQASGLLHGGTVVGVTAQVIAEDRGFTGVIARLSLSYDRATGVSDLPAKLIAKFPLANRASTTHSQADDPHTRDRALTELRWYQELAQYRSILVPACFGAFVDADAENVLLLLEDVSPTTPGDAITGCTPRQARAVLDELAGLHTRFWPFVSGEFHIPEWISPFAAPGAAAATRFRESLAMLDKHGRVLPDDIRAELTALQTVFVETLAPLASAPATLIHGDMHLDNVLFRDDTTPVILDWAHLSRGPSALDVAPFLAGSLSLDDFATDGISLLHDYHTQLVQAGIARYSRAVFFNDCRRALLRSVVGHINWAARADRASISDREAALVDAVLDNGRLFGAMRTLETIRVINL